MHELSKTTNHSAAKEYQNGQQAITKSASWKIPSVNKRNVSELQYENCCLTIKATSGELVRVLQADITKYPADVIVCPFNSRLHTSQGIAKAIANVCGDPFKKVII